MSTRVAIYPGTFDPITFGHMDIIKRALAIADKLVVAVAVDTAKTPLFTLDERVALVEQEIAPLRSTTNTEIIAVGFEGLVVNYAKEQGATILIRGLRAVSDFEYEFQMSGMNSKLEPSIQTVFLPASEGTHFIASRFVKEIVRLGGDVNGLVSKEVLSSVKQKLTA